MNTRYVLMLHAGEYDAHFCLPVATVEDHTSAKLIAEAMENLEHEYAKVLLHQHPEISDIILNQGFYIQVIEVPELTV